MYGPYIKMSVTKTLLIASLLAFTHTSNATSNDFKQQISIDADDQTADLKNKISTFIGNVVVIQGSLKITADTMKADASQGKGKEVFIATGTPAKYSQTLDDGKVITAQANEIRYELETRNLSLKVNAQLKQSDSLVKGDSILYDLEAQKLMASGADKQSNSRVTTIFTPEEKPNKSPE